MTKEQYNICEKVAKDLIRVTPNEHEMRDYFFLIKKIARIGYYSPKLSDKQVAICEKFYQKFLNKEFNDMLHPNSQSIKYYQK